VSLIRNYEQIAAAKQIKLDSYFSEEKIMVYGDPRTTIQIFDNLSEFIEEKLNAAFEALGVSTHEEVQELNKKVEKLTENVEILTKKLEQRKKPVTARTKA
ncbi:MAG: phasin family protein, partial [Calditrichia bacterium]